MAEYWKSLPRKFCDICKCWFADNKASIDFHERGKRHKENAQKRIQDIQKRGNKEFKKQQQLENEMEKIEKAALAAYKKDLQNMEDGGKSQTVIEPMNKHIFTTSESTMKPKSKSKPKLKPVKNVQQIQEVKIKEEEVSDEEPTPPQKVWYEGVTEEGYKYYWNSETSESRWEPPEEEFISVEDQNQVNTEPNTEDNIETNTEDNTETNTEDNTETNTEDNTALTLIKTEEQQPKSPEESTCTIKEEKIDSEDISSSIGPQPKVDPYGQWVTVEKKKRVKYDFQLPTPSENVVEIVIPVYKDDISLKIKEKVIGQLSDTDCANVTFKKRKFIGSSKKNARQRTTDDD